ncbi:hypothetical protein [Bacillus sp. MUM 13]|uniref:hypothetical protein n=1 Tax=Bacillus sp. MUM 13 TaxID=1678001 RepID=UPI0008F5D9D2|nr:hypothetical protein [Bacillus sp. MUM 13]OIK12651.1 hypothetical protein BIV59_08160 [Bacillus sp. MUM 13]
MPQTIIPGAAVRGTAAGVLFMAFFGTLWAGIGIRGLQGWGFLWFMIVSLLIGVFLLIGGIKLIKKSKMLSNVIMEGNSARHSKKMGIMFGIIFGLEGVFIATASAICSAANHLDLFVPVMALIVGAHFFPLARLFRVRIHYIAGTLLCLLAIVTLLILPVRITIEHHQIEVWWVTLGFGSALILWGTGAALWLTGLRLLKRDPERY